MPVDTSIYNNIRPYRMESQLDQAVKSNQLRAQNRQFTMEDDISAAASETGGDPERMSSTLMSKGHFAPAMQLRGSVDARKKAESDQNLKMFEEAGSDAVALDAFYRQALQESGGNKEAALAKANQAFAPIRDKWRALGKPMGDSFDPDKNFAFIGQAKNAVEYLKSLEPKYGAPVAARQGGRDVLIQPSQSGAAPRVVEGVTPRDNPTELARLQAERDALPENDPRRAEYDRVLSGYKAGRGDTNVTIQPPGPMQLGKAAANKVDEDMLGVTRNLMQLDTVASQWKPEYQRFQDKAGYAALKVKDSTVGLTNKEKVDLSDYSKYRRNAFNTLNEYIKSVTGAAMSEPEAQRITKGMPNPGSGLFDGDSPTEFKAKLDDAIGQTKKAVARLAYLNRKGMSLEDGIGKGISIEGMPALMNERGAEIEAELKRAQPNASKDALGKAVRRQLGIEFGLSSD